MIVVLFLRLPPSAASDAKIYTKNEERGECRCAKSDSKPRTLQHPFRPSVICCRFIGMF